MLVNGDTPIDIIGKVGEYFEDGDYWYNNGVGTFNMVLVRKPGIDHGDVNGTDAYLPDVEWLAYDETDYTHLGAHEAPCASICTPSVSIAATSSEICAGETVVVNATSENGGEAPTYEWTLNGDVVGTGSATLTTPVLSANAVINCSIVSNAACAPSSAVQGNTVLISVVPAPAPVASRTGNVLSASPVPNATYQWYLDGDEIPGATTAMHTATLAGEYTVTSIVDGCASEPSNVVEFDLSTRLIEQDHSSFALYPNPTDGPLTINTTGNVERIQVWNALGEKLLDVRQAQLDLRGYAAGLYRVSVLVDGQEHVRTIVVR